MSEFHLSDLVAIRGRFRLGVVGTYPGEDMAIPLASFGIKYHGEECRELTLHEARTLLVDLLWREQAYHSEIMSMAEAGVWADRIFATVFPPNARFLTNITELEPSKASSYCEIFSGTDATFSTGIIAVAAGALGCVWIEDED